MNVSPGHADLWIGTADVIIRRLFEKIDQGALDMNTITGVCPEMGKIPLTLENDRQALDIAIRCVGLVPRDNLKIMRIKNTSCLNEIDVSENYEADVAQRNDLEIIKEKHTLAFDADGNLLPF